MAFRETLSCTKAGCRRKESVMVDHMRMRSGFASTFVCSKCTEKDRKEKANKLVARKKAHQKELKETLTQEERIARLEGLQFDQEN